MKITVNIQDKTITNSKYQFPLSFQEAGFNDSDCQSREDYEDIANDWAADKYEGETVEIEVV